MVILKDIPSKYLEHPYRFCLKCDNVQPQIQEFYINKEYCSRCHGPTVHAEIGDIINYIQLLKGKK